MKGKKRRTRESADLLECQQRPRIVCVFLYNGSYFLKKSQCYERMKMLIVEWFPAEQTFAFLACDRKKREKWNEIKKLMKEISARKSFTLPWRVKRIWKFYQRCKNWRTLQFSSSHPTKKGCFLKNNIWFLCASE